MTSINQHSEAAKKALPEYAEVIDEVVTALAGKEDEKAFFGELALAIFAQDDGEALGAHLEAAGFSPVVIVRKFVKETRQMRIANNRDHQFRQYGNGKIRMYIERVSA